MDQGRAAAPAVGVVVVVGVVAQQAFGGLEVFDDGFVGVEDVHACVRGDVVGEAAGVVDGDDGFDAGGVGDEFVLFAEGGGDVDDAGAVVGGDVVGGEHLVGVGAAGEEVEGGPVAEAEEVAAFAAFDDPGGVAELAGVGGEAGFGEEVAGAFGFDDGVVDVGVDGRGEVGREGPGGGGPDEEFDAGEGGVAGDVEADGDGGVLPVAVGVVHFGLGGGEGGLAAPAVPQDAVALVDQALVVEGLEGPHDAFHVVQVERLVVVVEVDPAGLAGDVVLPFVGELEDGGFGGGVEPVDAVGFDVGFGFEAEFAFGGDFGGHAVGVPAEAAFDAAAAHGLVAGDDVLDVAGEEVPVVGQAVGEGGAVVEDEFVGSGGAGLAVVHGGLEGAVLGPEVEDAAFDLGQVRARRHAPGGVVEWICHGSGVSSSHLVVIWCARTGAGPAVPPRLARRWARPLVRRR